MLVGARQRLFVVALLVAVAATGCLFPVPRTTGEIELLTTTTIEIDGHTAKVDHYRNNAYRCGKSGYFTFVVIEPLDAPGSEAPLWIFLRGGGVGHFDADGDYHGGAAILPESFSYLLSFVTSQVVVPTTGDLKDTLIARRIFEGYRVLVPSYCDQDLYAGDSTRLYPHNPNWGGTDTVDGLSANMAATDFVTGSETYPTTHVFVHGASSGSVGAWALSYAYAREGIRLTGAVMDSYVMTERIVPVFEAGITPMNADPEFDLAAVQEKVGPFASDLSLLPENAIADGYVDVPIYSLVGKHDEYCGGNKPVIPVAAAAGYDNNCRFVYGALNEAVAAQPGSPHRALVYPIGGHVLTRSVGGWNDDIDAWLDGILASDPAHPFARSTFTAGFDQATCDAIDAAADDLGTSPPGWVALGVQLLIADEAAGAVTPPLEPPANDGPCTIEVTWRDSDTADLRALATEWGVSEDEVHHLGALHALSRAG